MIDAMEHDALAVEASRLLKALGHPSRLSICCQLREGEMSVGKMETTLGIRQPNLSRELARLREDRIVTTRRESRVVFYRLDDPRAHALIDAVCEVMRRTLGGNGSPQQGERRQEPAEIVAPAEVVLEAQRQMPRGNRSGIAAGGLAGGVAAARGAGASRTGTEDTHGQSGGYGVFARTEAASNGGNHD